MSNSTSVSAQADFFIFRKRDGNPQLFIFKKHKNKLFIAILETKYPIDSFITEVTAAILNLVVGKYNVSRRKPLPSSGDECGYGG